MIQKKHIIQQLSIAVVILLNFTTHAHSISDDENTNTSLTKNTTTIGVGNPVGANTTLNANGWMYTVDLLKDDCLNDFMETGNSIKNRFSQLVGVYNQGYSQENESSAARTFGLRKRLMGLALPLMFKFGVMFTVILTILALVIKSVIIGKMILILNVIGIVLKLVSLKKGHDGGGGGGYHHQSIPVAWVGGGHGGWDTHAAQKEIHLHIHNNGGHQTSYESVPSGGHAGYGPYPSGSTGYGTISRNDGNTFISRPTQQTQQVIQRVIPYDPYATSSSSNEYILV